MGKKKRKIAKAKLETRSAAVQGGELWGGPRVISDFTGEPILVRTKKQYFALMRKHGLRMDNQQESVTGDGPKGEAFVTPKPPPVVVVPPMTQDEAHLFGAVGALYRRYGLKEALTCKNCFARSRESGMRVIVSNLRVVLQCRCGIAEYNAPTGTTDLVLNTLANSAITQNDRTVGTIRTDIGQVDVPTFVLHDMESVLLRRYLSALMKRDIEPHLFHAGSGDGQGCWSRNPRNFGDEVGFHATKHEIVVTCPCRTLFWRRGRAEIPVLH